MKPQPPCPNSCGRFQTAEQRKCCVSCPTSHTMFCQRRYLRSHGFAVTRLSLVVEFVHPLDYDPTPDFVYYLSDPMNEDGDPVNVVSEVVKEQWAS